MTDPARPSEAAWLLRLCGIAEQVLHDRDELWRDTLTVPPRTVADEDAIIAHLALRVRPLLAIDLPALRRAAQIEECLAILAAYDDPDTVFHSWLRARASRLRAEGA